MSADNYYMLVRGVLKVIFGTTVKVQNTIWNNYRWSKHSWFSYVSTYKRVRFKNIVIKTLNDGATSHIRTNNFYMSSWTSEAAQPNL